MGNFGRKKRAAFVCLPSVLNRLDAGNLGGEFFRRREVMLLPAYASIVFLGDFE